jgi:ABC-type phosphate/phosphonate transport system substrate-binding protein
MTVADDVIDPGARQRFVDLLLAMDYADALARPLLDLEGLRQWLPGRLENYQPLEQAVDNAKFYDAAGNITSVDYRP